MADMTLPARLLNIERLHSQKTTAELRDRLHALRIRLAELKRDNERLEKLLKHCNMNRADVDRLIERDGQA